MKKHRNIIDFAKFLIAVGILLIGIAGGLLIANLITGL